MDNQLFMKPPTPVGNDMQGSLPNVSMPPPTMSAPPPNMAVPPPNMPGAPGQGQGGGNFNQRFNNNQQFQPRQFFRSFQPFVPRGPIGPMTLEDFDGKRLRKSVMRKTVDYNSAIIEALETRIWHRDYRDRRALQPDVMYYPEMLPPPSYPDNAINCVTTRFVKTATNKMRCPIFCMAWTPEGRRLVTGASSGEFTLWNGLTFNFETILQAHDSPVRTMVWSHNDNWMVTGDHAGYVKYWQSNMNNVKMFQAHKEALRGISFSPSDSKFVTCSDDGTLRIWDFLHCHEEHVLRGHGADVKCVQWHPQKSLIISGSKDNQQPIKLWDPKTGQSLATLHAHKSTVMDLKWNDNGNWLITASRDHLLKLFDLRNLNQEVQTFRGHKKEASSVAWHPAHEGLFASGGSDGSIMFWHVGADKEVGAIEQAHDSIVWTLAWHPLGHILCSGSNDHSSKFWTRNRPGDMMRDKYNLNTLPAGLSGLEDFDADEPSVIPGMGPEDKVEITLPSDSMVIPGLDLDAPPSNAEDKPNKTKKVPYSKPIPRNFQAQWNDTEEEGPRDSTISEVISHIVENTPGVVPLQKIAPSAIIVYGKVLPVEPGSVLEKKIAEGPEALKRYIASGAIEELHDVMPHEEDDDYLNDDDDTSTTTPLTLPNVVLPTPLPSSKLQNLAALGAPTLPPTPKIPSLLDATLPNMTDKVKSERPRKSRFSDINESTNSNDSTSVNVHFNRPQFNTSNNLDNTRSNSMDMFSNQNSNFSTNNDENRRQDQDYRDLNRSIGGSDYRDQGENYRDQGFRNLYQQDNSNSFNDEMDDYHDEDERDRDSPKRGRFDSFRDDRDDNDDWQFRNWDNNDNGDFNGMNNFANDNFGGRPSANNFGNNFRPPSGGSNFGNRQFGNQNNFRNDGPSPSGGSGWNNGGGGGGGGRNNDNFRGNRGFRGRGSRRNSGRGGPRGPQRGRNTFN